MEFISRLTKGLQNKYWRILEEKEALDLWNKDGIYLHAGFMLGMPVLLSADINETYFRPRVSAALTHLSHFLMYYNHKTQQLTAQATKRSKLVTIQALVLIMGVSQSPAVCKF